MDCLRIGVLLFACLAGCQALTCFECSNCGKGVPNMTPIQCGSGLNFCVYTRIKDLKTNQVRINRGCNDEEIPKMECAVTETQGKTVREESCSATCTGNNCNSVYPATTTTTTTTTTTRANGAGEVAASRLAVLVVGSLTALAFLKF